MTNGEMGIKLKPIQLALDPLSAPRARYGKEDGSQAQHMSRGEAVHQDFLRPIFNHVSRTEHHVSLHRGWPFSRFFDGSTSAWLEKAIFGVCPHHLFFTVVCFTLRYVFSVYYSCRDHIYSWVLYWNTSANILYICTFYCSWICCGWMISGLWWKRLPAQEDF
jgi:hypothetical protein